MLVISSDVGNSRVIEEVSNSWMLESVVCPSLTEAKSLLGMQGFGVIFCQDQLQDGTYRELLSAVRHPACRTRVVVLISDGDKNRTCRDAMELGAFDVVPSPCAKKDVQWVIIRATQDRSMTALRAG